MGQKRGGTYAVLSTMKTNFKKRRYIICLYTSSPAFSIISFIMRWADSHPCSIKTLVTLLSQELDTGCKFISQAPPWLISSITRFPHLLLVLVTCHPLSETFHDQPILNDHLCPALPTPFLCISFSITFLSSGIL